MPPKIVQVIEMEVLRYEPHRMVKQYFSYEGVLLGEYDPNPPTAEPEMLAAPVESVVPEPKPKRKRRTKAEMIDAKRIKELEQAQKVGVDGNE